MVEGREPTSVPERQVFLSTVHGESGSRDGGPDVAVIELELQDLLDISIGSVKDPGSSHEADGPVTTTDVAWTTLPSDYRGLAYETLHIVRDCAVQWSQAVWMDEAALEGFGALPTRSSRCHKRGTDFVWVTDHPDFGKLRSDPVKLVNVLTGVLYVGDARSVREMCRTMANLCPEVLASALLAGAGPRFGVADRDITRRSIVDLVGHDELRPLLFHDSERVRRAAQQALGEEGPPTGGAEEEESERGEASGLDPAVQGELRRRGLLPEVGRGGAELPSEPVHSSDTYRSRYRGCLLAGAVGDALGRPGEGRPPDVIRERYGSLTDYHRWPGWESGPVGTITDDTQLTRCVAETYLAKGWLDPEDLARRLIAWLPEGRGKGRTCTTAVLRLGDGVPWHEAGVQSAGNGAAMRSAPVGLAHPFDLEGLRRDAAVHTVVTHADGMAVASSVALAFGCARLLHTPAGELDPEAFLAEVVAALEGVPDPGHPERRPEAGPEPVRLAERLSELPDLLDGEPGEVFGYLYNGAFVLESLPAAFWCFLRSPVDPERVLVTAADGGYDADTVASMAGNLVGAYRGEEALPDRWLAELEGREELRQLADGLLELAGLADGG